ncbi:MAG: NnrU family protein [Gammaproteobacteria bacterium]
MWQLLLGLVLFIGVHSMSIVALPLRDGLAAKNEIAWKALYGVVSLIGIVLVADAYSGIRHTAMVIYDAPDWLRYVAMVLLAPAFVLFPAPYFPGRIKAAAKHPQLLAVKLWALAHLLVNGTVADILLFGSFMAWAVADRISMKRRVARPLSGAPESGVNDAIVVVIGLVLYTVTLFWFHERLIGVDPFGTAP